MRQAWLLAVLALSAGCAGAEQGPSFPTSSSFETQTRRPPSFAPEANLAPEASSAGSAAVAIPREPGRNVMPLDPEAARDVVTRFFIAVLLESSSDLFPLLASQAWAISEGSRQPAQALWRARLAQLDYTSLSGRVVAAPQTLRTYTFLSRARAKRDGVLVPASEDEVVIVARPALSWAGKTRLLGDDLAFRLRPKQGQPAYEIAEIVEDFRLP